MRHDSLNPAGNSATVSVAYNRQMIRAEYKRVLGTQADASFPDYPYYLRRKAEKLPLHTIERKFRKMKDPSGMTLYEK